MHAVFDVASDSRYSKDFWHRYDIPTKTAVETARACIGDWIIFRQTGVGGYVAVARVDDVIPDPERPGFSVALMGDYLPFTSPRPFKVGKRYAEQVLRHTARLIHIGRLIQGKPIRELLQLDFIDITLAGFARTVKASDDTIALAREPSGFEEHAGPMWEYEPGSRAIQELFVRRAFRDANFRLEVMRTISQYLCVYRRCDCRR